MSIAVLQQVYDETRRLAVAGSGLASGDFRLKKLVDPLEKSAAKAPVFGKVAEAVKKLVDANQDQASTALLELNTLVTAILYTQGETGAAGTLEPIQTVNIGLPSANTSARVLKPLIEALTNTGSGRMELIKDAHERGAFKDLRLLKYAVAAIEDKYGEIGEFVTSNILPMYGKAIYPMVQKAYDPKGKTDAGRRLKLLHKLDPESTKPLVDAALDDGSKEVRLAAIQCLHGRVDAVDFLLQQAKAKAQEVRGAALAALSPIDRPEVISVLTEAVSGKDVGLVARHIPQNPNASLKQFVVEEAERQLAGLLDSSKKPKAATAATSAKNSNDAMVAFHQLLCAFRGRTDKAAEAFLLNCFSKQEELLKLKAGYLDGESLNKRVAEMMLLCGSKGTLAKLVEAGPKVIPALIEYTFLAAAKVLSPAQVFELFSKAYATRPEGKAKATFTTSRVSHGIGSIIGDICNWKKHEPYQVSSPEDTETDDIPDMNNLWEIGRKVDLDPRWLDEAVKLNDLDLMIHLAVPGHKGLNKALVTEIDSELAKKKWDPSHMLDDVLEAMIQINHPDLVPKIITVVERFNSSPKDWWGQYFLARVIPKLPATAIEPLEAMIPKINEKLLDSFVGPLEELKQRHKPA